MERSKVFFSCEDNTENNELYQLLNWQFQVSYYHHSEDGSYDEIKQVSPELVIISLDERNHDIKDLLEYIKKECADIPVIILGTEVELEEWAGMCKGSQFHTIIRPVKGKRVLELCKAIIEGEGSSENLVMAESNEKSHILVVDDNAMMLRNIKGILEEKYSVAVAPSGAKAFTSMHKQLPDLILLDYEMPEMNGRQVLEKIQSDSVLKEIPVVFLTSVDSRVKVMNLLALRPAGYILKPVEPEVLMRKIEQILGR